MIIRIGLFDRIPANFRAEHRFAVNHRRNFVIACAEIKPNAAAIEMPTDARADFAGFRHSAHFDGFDRERMLIHPRHQIRVKPALAGGGVFGLNRLAEIFRPAERDFPAALRPEQKFDVPFNHAQRVGVMRGAGRENFYIVAADQAVFAFDGNRQRDRAAGLRDGLPVRSIRQRERNVLRV